MKVSGTPGLFKVGTSGHKTTTIGTWITKSIPLRKLSIFEDYESSGASDDIPVDLTINYDTTDSDTNVVLIDTEGINYQTESGENYDIVMITPSVLIAENVFLVVNDRLKPSEVTEQISKFSKAAEKAHGGFTHRNNKIFGRLVIAKG